MGLFGKGGETESGQRGGTTVVAEGARLVGELNLEGKLHVDGRIEGTIHCRGDVSIGRQGRFEGTLNANRLLVSGRVEGAIQCDALEIVEGGYVRGEVSTEQFVIEPGGQFIGESVSREETVQVLPHDARDAEFRAESPTVEREAPAVGVGEAEASDEEPTRKAH